MIPAKTFAWASTQCGIAEFCSFFPFLPAQTLELSATTLRLHAVGIWYDPLATKSCWICLNRSNYSNFRCFAEWLLACRSRIVCEHRPNNQVLYVLPLESILVKLPVVPIGETGTIPYCMRQHAEDFLGAAFDTRKGAGDDSRWWYINMWALSWSRERGEKWKSLASHPAYFKMMI
jgi:hypothetical protein